MVETERREGAKQLPFKNDRRARVSTAPRTAAEEKLLLRRSLFVDNGRFWSMVAIVAYHTTITVLGSRIPPQSLWLLESLLKFGTISFFILSGFLLGERFETGSPASFLRRRLEKILLPWLVWFTLMAAWPIGGAIIRHNLSPAFDLYTMQALRTAAIGTLTGTAFWFVPNLFFSMCMLLVFRKHLRSVWLGSALFLVTLFYTVNIYACWMPSSHTLAFGGYVFFIWLGAFFSRNFAAILRRMQCLSPPVMVLIAVSLWLLSVGEAHIIRRVTPSEPMNTLKFSNQLFSVAMVLIFLRLQETTWPKLLDVRNQMFGVYLTHSLLLYSLISLARRSSKHFSSVHYGYSEPQIIVFSLFFSAVVFVLSAALTRAIASQPRLRWLVGDLSVQRAPSPDVSGKFSMAAPVASESMSAS